MGIRRKARELALKTLFEADFNGQVLTTIFDRIQHTEQPEPDALRFLEQILQAYTAHKSEINKTIEKNSNNWKLARMASVDRNILRLGVAEILFLEDVPKNVTINEYLEIAKKFGTEESSSFVNGILDKVVKKT